MMRLSVTLATLLAAAPLSAQDHSAHASHEESGPSTVDHCAMGHLPPELCASASPRETVEAAPHEAMDHAGHDAGPDRSDHAGMDHSGHGTAMEKSAPGAAPESAVPPRALEGPRHAADAIWGADAMAPARRRLARENGGMTTGTVLVERFEARLAPESGGHDGYLWDAQAWYGGDVDRLVVKSEGEGEFDGALEDAEIQALYSHAIGPFFDLQAGIRLDVEPDTRPHAVIGVQGLAPYMIHVDGALFLSDRGDLTARVEGEYDQKITQRLILQPRIEMEFSAQDIAERGVGAGVTRIEPGLRLRYEILPEVAPYVGVEYEAKLGETAAMAKAAGDDPDGLKILLGLRAWF